MKDIGNGVEVLEAEGYADSYYWDVSILFKYNDAHYWYFDCGSGSGYIDCVRGIRHVDHDFSLDSLPHDWEEDGRFINDDDEYLNDFVTVYIDGEELSNAARFLESTGESEVVLYSDAPDISDREIDYERFNKEG